ncbi:MAG: tetratricopeptide repeat protein [Deltaproteobacteria bacterium]|nr:tetratricopeptide repeat protein [Deltaproteobacteria bacterium]
MTSRATGTAVSLAALLWAGGSVAAEPRSTTEAQAIFQEARKLDEAGDLKSACALYEKALALEPNAIGGRLHLARCLERLDKLASAVAEYERAEIAANAANQPDRSSHARKQIQLLAPRVGTVVIEVPRAVRETAADLLVRVDETPIPDSRWGQAVPADAGPHTVSAAAPGRAAFAARIDVKNGGRYTVEVPILLRRHAPVWPWIVGGVGLAMGGAAFAFAYDQSVVQAEIDEHCKSTPCDRLDGFEPNIANARLSRDFGLALGLGIGGGLALGAGVLGLVLGRDDGTATSAKFTPIAGPNVAGALVAVAW